MSTAQKNTAAQSQNLMVFVLSMSLYGLATLFTEHRFGKQYPRNDEWI